MWSNVEIGPKMKTQPRRQKNPSLRSIILKPYEVALYDSAFENYA